LALSELKVYRLGVDGPDLLGPGDLASCHPSNSCSFDPCSYQRGIRSQNRKAGPMLT